ncbi:type IV pilus assembly protein PilO [Desulfofundulus luciae]|uniref:Type IV pilus assembly protein PilO n=1 Tax=Desulfofundulus luciae TaxID=74702 RepID=A0ABU0B1C4_9FIRM|nr:type 4a pilus biogenesis protein PilO [Desulfofundulus luciae]MDQ0286531.1 type IV pilus assembly protein PilO [Desulfofundulus luciae]
MARGLSKKSRTILILLLLLAFIYAGYRFVLMPQIQAYQKTKTELNEARTLISRLSTRAGSLEEEKKVLEKARKRFLELNKRFDTDMQDGQFLVQFSRVTEKNRVLVLKFKPLAIVDRGYMLVLPVEIELKGLFPQVSVVIDYLENLPNLSELRNIQITRYEPENAGGQSPALTDGTVTASTTLLLYSRPTPAGRLQLEEVRRWALGRPNPFFSGRPPVSSALPEQAAETAGQEPVPASVPERAGAKTG